MKLEDLNWENEIEKCFNNNDWNGLGEDAAKMLSAERKSKREKMVPKERFAGKELKGYKAHNKRKKPCCAHQNPFKHYCWDPCKDRHWPACDDPCCKPCKDHWEPCEEHKEDPCKDHHKPCKEHKDPCRDHHKPRKEHKDPCKPKQ